MKLISWNVNGLRAAFKKDLAASLAELDADIVALQETRLQDGQLTDDLTRLPGYESHWACATAKKGYSGVAVFTRRQPRSVTAGLGDPLHDAEGRTLELDYGDFTLFNVYFPNGQQGPERLQYKLDFYRDFFARADRLKDEGRRVIVCGDYNTAHNEIDLKNPKANENYSGFLRIERDCLDRMVASGWVDTFRHFHPDTVRYSWWSYRFGARERNIGWRIDYVFVTENMIAENRVRSAFIEDMVMGSDHCPVGVEIDI